MSTMRYVILVLVIIGALNWGLIGFFNFDLIATLFDGQTSMISRVIFGLVGLAGIYAITFLFPHRMEVEPDSPRF